LIKTEVHFKLHIVYHCNNCNLISLHVGSMNPSAKKYFCTTEQSLSVSLDTSDTKDFFQKITLGTGQV